MLIIVVCRHCLRREILDMKSTDLWNKESLSELEKHGECSGWACPDCGARNRIIKHHSTVEITRSRVSKVIDAEIKKHLEQGEQ